MRRWIPREVNLTKLSVFLRLPTWASQICCDQSTGIIDKTSPRTTLHVNPKAYSCLSVPPSLDATYGSTIVDTKLRGRVHSHISVLCGPVLCFCTTSGSHSTNYVTCIGAFGLSSSQEADLRFPLHCYHYLE